MNESLPDRVRIYFLLLIHSRVVMEGVASLRPLNCPQLVIEHDRGTRADLDHSCLARGTCNGRCLLRDFMWALLSLLELGYSQKLF